MEKVEHLYSKPQLDKVLEYYNEILKYLKVTGHFGVEDKIVDIKRGFVFDDSKMSFWDYLDFTHAPVEKSLGKEGGLSCVKFILNNGKEVNVVEHNEGSKEIPEGFYSIDEFLHELEKASLNDYASAVLNILGQLNVFESEYFNSKGYKTRQAEQNILSILGK